MENNPIVQLLKLFAIDGLFLLLLAAVVIVPLSMLGKRAALAVLRRNFVGYFSNPTGYVFLCIFVVLTSLGAFFPHEFFSNNLANLEQLNKWLPLIMLIFIPAITMSIWAEERRQGTDELLLTLPAADFDIVVGKYLAASSIFTVSLLFSQLSAYAVLVSLTKGDMDTGLIFTTYLGYWFIGLTMLALGMVASFLTSNLTVGFILGVLFNAPLVLAKTADIIIAKSNLASMVSRWSINSQFDDFGRGVISLASTAYFIMVAVLGVYLSMVLIGSRHWFGGRDGQSMFGHYVVRALSLVAIILGVSYFLSNYDVIRADTTRNQVSSLSSDTKRIVRGLKNEYPIEIDAYLSANMPERYVKTKYDLLSLLKEFNSLAGKGIRVNIHDNLERASEAAREADQEYGITPRSVTLMSRGTIREEQVILGVGFRCGLEKVVVPFLDYGVPVEYELVRSLSTVAQGERTRRKKIGIVETDAQMMGGFTMNFMSPSSNPEQAIIGELRKQYTVEKVDLNEPITEGKYDVLVAVQPSSLGPQQMAQLVDAVRKGVPTAIFEDPAPLVMSHVPGTADERRGGGMMGGGGPPPKGNVRDLWRVVGVTMLGDGAGAGGVSADLVWQKFNPYRKLQLQGIGPELVFVRNDQPHTREAKPAFNPDDPAVATLEEVLLPFPGAIVRDDRAEGLDFVEMVRTGDNATGRINAQEWIEANRMGIDAVETKRGESTGKQYVLAARIKGKKSGEKKDAEKDEAKDDAPKPESNPLNVTFIADVDCLHSQFIDMRARPENEFFGDVRFNFDNVSFVLNIIDELAGEDRFHAIRTRKFKHSTLLAVEEKADVARRRMEEQISDFQKEYDSKVRESEKSRDESLAKFKKRVEEMQQKKAAGAEIDYSQLQAYLQELSMQERVQTQKAEADKERMKREFQSHRNEIELTHEQEVQRIQNWFKGWAIALPPLPPLLLGLVVYARRRLREREGIAKTRMK